jgi:hypothetical protein
MSLVIERARRPIGVRIRSRARWAAACLAPGCGAISAVVFSASSVA